MDIMLKKSIIKLLDYNLLNHIIDNFKTILLMKKNYRELHEIPISSLTPLQLAFQRIYDVSFFTRDDKFIMHIQGRWNASKKKLMVFDQEVNSLTQICNVVFPASNSHIEIINKFNDVDAAFTRAEMAEIISAYDESVEDYYIHGLISMVNSNANPASDLHYAISLMQKLSADKIKYTKRYL